MRIIETEVYKFDELSEDGKKNAIETKKIEGIDTDFIYDDAHETVKKFHELFNTKEGNRSWLDWGFDASGYSGEVENLKGIRLRTWIINNYWNDLYKGKYFGEFSKVDFEEGKTLGILKSRRSKAIFDNSCVLTGVCYDVSLLNPIYNFINHYDRMADYYSYMNLDTLFNDCFEELQKDIVSEVEGMSEDGYIIEQLENDDLEYTINGTEF